MDMLVIDGDVIFRTWQNMMVFIPNENITPITTHILSSTLPHTENDK